MRPFLEGVIEADPTVVGLVVLIVVVAAVLFVARRARGGAGR